MEENNNTTQMANENDNNLLNNEIDNTAIKEVANETSNQKESCNKCNKSLVIIALVVSVIALVVSIVSLLQKGDNETTKAKVGKVMQSGNMKIAYINTDTIMAKYTMAIEMQKELKNKQTSLENSLKNQYTQLQKEEQEYLRTGQNLTLTQQQAKEKEFKQREQQLSQAMQQQPAQFQQEVASQNEKLLNAVLAFVNDYNAKHDKYNIILSYSRYNGPTLYIDEGLDITDEIVKGLNEEYKNVKGK